MSMKYIISLFLLVLALPLLNAAAEVAMHYYVLDSWGNNAPNLEIKLPNDWEYKKNEGPDFDVHWFIAPENRGSLGIYVGHHPSFKEPKGQPSIQRHVGNKLVPFYRTKTDSALSFHALVEGFFLGSSGAGVEAFQLHLMINETKSGFAEDAFQYLKTLRVKAAGG